MTRSQASRPIVFGTYPVDSANQLYSRVASSFCAISSASLFSNPSAFSLENGRLSGSAQTRKEAALAGAALTAPSSRTNPILAAVAAPRRGVFIAACPLKLVSRRSFAGKVRSYHSLGARRPAGKCWPHPNMEIDGKPRQLTATLNFADKACRGTGKRQSCASHLAIMSARSVPVG